MTSKQRRRREALINNSLIRAGWSLLLASIIGWPLSALTFAKHEPATVLALSWIAIILTAGTMLIEAYLKKSVDDD